MAIFRYIILIVLKFLNFYNTIYNYLLFKIANVKYELFPSISGKVIKRGRGPLILGNKCKINSSITANPVGLISKCMFYIGPSGIIKIGNNVGISNSLLYSICSIIVEDDVMIGGGCQILDNDFHSLRYEDRILLGDKNVNSAPISIKKGAFIGTSSIILKGVTIGERSIVAAGSVVTKSIPDNEIWGGNPAAFIRKISENDY